MSPDDNTNANAEEQKTKKSDTFQDLSAAKVSGKDADKVKGGFNPQPDPPARGRAGSQ
jgi:hypothetical protein